MSIHAHSKHPVWSTCLLSIALLVGCQSSKSTLNTPQTFQPEGSQLAQGLPADQLPEIINLSDPTSFSRRIITPTIIDTRDFPIQRQVVGPFVGDPKLVKHRLPKHSRDKSLRSDPNNRPLPIGQTIDIDRVQPTGGTPGSGFEGISQTGWNPPDPTLAVGPTHIVETVNTSIAFFDRNGNETFSTRLGDDGSPGFFETAGADSSFVFDPKCFYDQKTDRFIVVALEHAGDTESWIDIAISDDSDPNGIWYKYRTFSVIQVGNNNYWVDYPGLGSDDDAFYVTGNLFYLNGPDDDGFAGQLFRTFDKAPMLVGDPVTITDIAPDNGASLQVAQMFGPSPQCYFLSRRNSESLRLWTINDPLGNPSIDFVTVGQMGSAFGPSQNAPNPGGGLLSTLDGRLMNVHYRDGNLYTAHAIDGPPGITVARWYHIDVNGWPSSGSNPNLIQQGEIVGSNGQHHFYPVIYSDQFNNVGMVMSRSSASEFASVQATGRAPSDPLGSMSTTIELAIGDAGGDGRWGDYLDIAMDPNDDTTFWIMGMYRLSSGWQTYIDSFTIASPCQPDLNGDGDLNFFDISAFLIAFNAGDTAADFNDDGVFNFFDISAFLILFNQGCP